MRWYQLRLFHGSNRVSMARSTRLEKMLMARKHGCFVISHTPQSELERIIVSISRHKAVAASPLARLKQYSLSNDVLNVKLGGYTVIVGASNTQQLKVGIKVRYSKCRCDVYTSSCDGEQLTVRACEHASPFAVGTTERLCW